MPAAPHDRIAAALHESADNFRKLADQAPLIAAVADRVTAAILGGGKVMLCGNGGSAADSQHIAAELLGRFVLDRRPLPAIALTVDTSALTAIGNDFGFDEVFSRQVLGLGRPGDVLLALSTSGNSRNVLAAVEAARGIGVYVVGLTGAGGGRMAGLCDVCIRVPSTVTARIQEMHIAVGHLVCELAEEALA